MTETILVEGLTYIYPNDTKAVDGMFLSVDRGEIFGLLGINGAGKTTIIKVLTTLLRPTSGKVRVLGHDVTEKPVEIKKKAGVVPQENNLDTRLTVRQNLIFHCRYFGFKKKEYIEKVDEWIEFLGLKNKENGNIFHLSGGTKRKVMLAKAFLTMPELLILDEPTSGLDPEVRGLVWSKISEFRESGGTVFLSTHYLEEAERLCDRIGIIHQGRLMIIGKPEELKKRAKGNGFLEDAGIEDVFHLTIGGLL